MRDGTYVDMRGCCVLLWPAGRMALEFANVHPASSGGGRHAAGLSPPPTSTHHTGCGTDPKPSRIRLTSPSRRSSGHFASSSSAFRKSSGSGTVVMSRCWRRTLPQQLTIHDPPSSCWSVDALCSCLNRSSLGKPI